MKIMVNKITKSDLFNLAIQAHEDGYQCFINGSGEKVQFYSGMLSAYTAILIEFFDCEEADILAKVKNSHAVIDHSGY